VIVPNTVSNVTDKLTMVIRRYLNDAMVNKHVHSVPRNHQELHIREFIALLTAVSYTKDYFNIAGIIYHSIYKHNNNSSTMTMTTIPLPYVLIS